MALPGVRALRRVGTEWSASWPVSRAALGLSRGVPGGSDAARRPVCDVPCYTLHDSLRKPGEGATSRLAAVGDAWLAAPDHALRRERWSDARCSDAYAKRLYCVN